jgi:hypothetical protein
LTDLVTADLTETNLSAATLRRADLTEANPSGPKWNPNYPPEWPDGFDPPKNAWDHAVPGG